MIDIGTEQLIPFREVPRLLPPRPTGRRVHISAVYRWLNRGLGGICLESIKIGGTTYTSVEALQRFADGLSGKAEDSREQLAPSTSSRRRQIRETARRVDLALRSGKTGQRVGEP